MRFVVLLVLSGGVTLAAGDEVAAFRAGMRRLVVHTICICDTGPESAKWMRARAERSGGSYVWATTPR